MTERSTWSERNTGLLPWAVLALVWGVLAMAGVAFVVVMLTWILLWIACMLILATVAVYRSRDHARWSGLTWLPLRGRWLCYSVTALLAVPASMVSLLVFVVLVSSITRAVAG